VISKILIIDDEIIFCNALRYHLTQKGYAVKVCTSYTEFQNHITLWEFDLVLLDLNLEDIKGIDLLQIAMGMNPDIKIIVVSAYLDDHNIEKAKELGAYECTHKNSQMFKILDRIIESM
jgi:DNA-binding NtrC family response regulator